MAQLVRTIALGVAAAGLVAPASALGSKARAHPAVGNQYKVSYETDPSEVNDVWVTPRAGHLLRIKDAGALLIDGGWGCTTEVHGSTCGPGIGWVDVATAPLDPPGPDPNPFTTDLGPGNDKLFADEPLAVQARGGDGNDLLIARGTASFNGGAGADVFDGGPGPSDLVFYMIPDVGVHVTIDGIANDGAPGEGDNVLPSIETVWGSHGDDVLVGNDQNNTLIGLIGRDLLQGGGGNDRLSGAYQTTAEGGDGADQIDFDWGVGVGAVADGGAGNDGINVTFVGATVDAGAGDDIVAARNFTSPVQFASRIACGDGNDTVYVDPSDTVAGDCENVVP